MTMRYANPALEAELAWRHERLQAAGRGRGPRLRWLPRTRRTLP